METTRTPVFHRYSVLEKIGSGGMGTVYKAHDRHLDRLVALKVLPPALQEDEAALERFKREARALAHLNHPRVAAVFDASVEGGFPHLVMELVEGENLERLLKSRRVLPAEEAARIGIHVAEALAHIHEHGIVHRDVKTSNIIMEPTTGAVLADFGIALEGSMPRLSQAALGTPEYMSPEQAEGRRLDGRSDCYSLGVVLFECLAGRPPFRRDGDSLASLMDLMHRVTTEPVAPLADHCPDLPRWLTASVMRCLEKDPADRFESAGALAAALQRGLATGEVPEARTSTRRRTSARAENGAWHGQSEDEPVRSRMRRVVEFGGRAVVRNRKTAARPAHVDGAGETTVLTHVEAVQSVAFGPNGRLVTGSNDGVVRLWDAAEGRLMHELRGHEGSVSAVAFSRDGRFVASGDRTGRICVWDGGTGRRLRDIDAMTPLVLTLAFSPDARLLASGGGDRAVRLWNVRSGRLADTAGRHQGYVLAAAFTGDGSRLVTSGSDGMVLVWDVERPDVAASIHAHIHAHEGWAMAADVSGDGRVVVSGGTDGRLRIWKDEEAVHDIEAHRHAVMAAAMSPSGRFVLSAGRDGSVSLWDVRTGAFVERLGEHDGAVTSVAFSPDGRFAAAAGDDRTVRIWRIDRRGFGPRRRWKRALAWSTAAILVPLLVFGPLDVSRDDLGAFWSDAAQHAGYVFPGELRSIFGGMESDPADSPDDLAGAATAERSSDGPSERRTEPSERRVAAPAEPTESRAAEPSEHRAAESSTDQRTRSETTVSPRAAGPPNVALPGAEPPPAEAPPSEFHPLYGGGKLVVGVDGWTIEVGRLRSRRGAAWLVEQYRGMGYRAGILDLGGEGLRFLVGVGHFRDAAEAESTLRKLRGRDLPFRIGVTRLQWDRMVAEQ